jgi:hypothetical protein
MVFDRDCFLQHHGRKHMKIERASRSRTHSHPSESNFACHFPGTNPPSPLFLKRSGKVAPTHREWAVPRFPEGTISRRILIEVAQLVWKSNDRYLVNRLRRIGESDVLLLTTATGHKPVSASACSRNIVSGGPLASMLPRSKPKLKRAGSTSIEFMLLESRLEPMSLSSERKVSHGD